MSNGSEQPANSTEADSRLSKRKLSEAISSLDAALKSTGVRVKKRKTSHSRQVQLASIDAELCASSAIL
ncbi:hypothetical protein NBRC10512v2_007453 [Rhodotorula toruloides]